MQKEINLDSFADELRLRILSGENPTSLRKWVRKERGVGKSAANDYYKKVDEGISKKERAKIPGAVEVVDVGKGKREFEENGETATATVVGVKNLEELVAYAGIDLSVWEPTKQKLSLWDGKSSFSAEFKKRSPEIDARNLLQVFIDEAKGHSPSKFVKATKNSEIKLIAFNLSDTHFGKRGVRDETGHEDYNLEKAAEIFEDAVSNLLGKALNYSSYSNALFIVGNDLFNSDGIAGATTGGTLVENDSSYYQVYKQVCKSITDSIEKLGSVIRKVEVLVTPGNHDFVSCFTLGQYLEAWFRNNENVVVINEVKPRKYYRFFNNLFCVTHGNEEKVGDLPLVMATESKDWSECKNREIWVGHTHKLSVTEDRGVVTRVFPSLSGCDFWHGKKSFVGNHRIGHVLVYNEDGLDAIFQYEPNLS